MLTSVDRCMVTELVPHVPASGIDKAQFGSLYAQARAKMLTPSAASKAFVDSGITINLSSTKDLSRLAGAVAAGHQSQLLQKHQEQASLVPQSTCSLDNMLSAFRDSQDPRTVCILKRADPQGIPETTGQERDPAG